MSTTEAGPRIHIMPSGKPCPDILTPDEVCEYFRMTGKKTRKQVARSIRTYMDSGLVAFKVSNKQLRFRLEEVLRFARTREAES